MAFKVFTNGSVLQASEVNDNLMRQAVSTFSNAAARTAAITAPSEGMLTYLEDVNRYDHWDGSAWVSPFGLTHLATGTVSAATGVVFSNVFSSVYTNYKFVIDGFGSANSQRFFARLRSGGTDLTANYFCGTAAVDQTTTSATILRTTASDAIDFGFISNNDGAQTVFSFDLSNPFTTNRKSYTGNLTGFNGGITNYMGFMGGLIGDTTSRDGINIYSPNNWTGTVRIYGYRNA
jgi:hypothetical protein